MPFYREAISRTLVRLPRRDLARMIRLVRFLFSLSKTPLYRRLVLDQLPEVAHFDPGHHGVMMGYDFHLSAEGPKLIEVNTNAGGGLLAYLSHFPDAAVARTNLPGRFREQFLESFAGEMHRFSGGRILKPRHIAIVDEEPETQYLFQEMVAFARMFEQWGVKATVADPGRLRAGPGGVEIDGDPVDLIYNRHCDFYLERPEMAGIRAAYLAKAVCLTPNPFVYGLLADKRRMNLWSDPEALTALGLPPGEVALLSNMVPQSFLLAEVDPEKVWKARNDWVFKPVSRFGSRGVLLGRKVSRRRFADLPPGETLVQRFVPPSVADTEAGEMKADFRLYVYRSRVLGVAARLYQGQVTNLRTVGGGFAPVKVV
jgi:hypothetical protein